MWESELSKMMAIISTSAIEELRCLSSITQNATMEKERQTHVLASKKTQTNLQMLLVCIMTATTMTIGTANDKWSLHDKSAETSKLRSYKQFVVKLMRLGCSKLPSSSSQFPLHAPRVFFFEKVRFVSRTAHIGMFP